MDRFFLRIRADLAKKDTDDRAYSRLLQISKEASGLDPKEPFIVELKAMLAGIPPGATCACCGYVGLTNVKRRGGLVLGPECVSHPLGSCKERRK